MSRRNQLLVVFMAVLAVTSAFSHLIAWKFKILTNAKEQLHFGKHNENKPAFAAGSSLAFYGIAWQDISEAINTEVIGYAVPGGSVPEMEVLFRRHPDANPTFIGISTYDSNEHHVCNYRAQIVPFGEAVRNLWAVRAEWTLTKEVLSQYPMQYIRAVFPTAGAYGAVMVRTRDILRTIFHTQVQVQKIPSEGAVITDKGNSQTSTIAEWTPAHLQRAIVDISSHGGANFEFHSTKRQSLFQFIHRGAAQGKVVVVVLPESPVYAAEFLTADVHRRFEDLLADAQKEAPETIFVRLDQVPELNSTKNYWDLIHMNAYGQAIATKILLEKLEAAGIAK